MPRSPLALKTLIASMALGASLPGAHAIGLGRPQAQSALGQALNFMVPVRLAAGETLGTGCAQAEVLAGDARLPQNQVLVQLEGEGEASVRALRVRSLVQVDEPLVTVSLSVGCPVRLIRQFTVFMDPPGSTEPSAVAEAPQLPDHSPALRAAFGTVDAKPSALLAPPATASSVAAARAAAVTAETPPRKPPARKRRPVAASAPASQAEAAAPRLRLEPAEALAASPPAADPQAQQRMGELEQSLQAMQAQQRATEARIAALQVELAQARQAGQPSSLLSYALGLLSLLLALACLWLWRAREQDRRRQSAAWWGDEQKAATRRSASKEEGVAVARMVRPSAAMPLPEPALDPALDPALHAPVDSTWTGLAPLVPAATEPPFEMPAAVIEPEPLSLQLLDQIPDPVPDPVSPRLRPASTGIARGTVEELIDLEQQVDFFLVLGQEQAAVELLQAHLGGGALPHLKLMELQQRRGERAAYEAEAADYAQRFGVLAPAWESDFGATPGLEAQGEVLARLQRRWRDRGAAMALLHELLVGPSGAGLGLPACRELLLLYAVARDLSEHDVRGEEIDLFLPLDSPSAKASSDMMATMMWQTTAGGHAGAPLQVDIPLDDAPQFKGG